MVLSVVRASTPPEVSAATHSEYVPNSWSWTPGYLSLTFWADVDPVTEHSFLPVKVSGPVIDVSSAFTKRSCPAMKYGPAKDTFALRSSVIEYVATTMLTCPVEISVSRWALGDWTNLMSPS